MNVICTIYGSAGDVHPMLGLALALRDRGHRITFATTGYFRELVERTGLEFVELGSREDFLKGIQDPDLWHPLRGFAFVMRKGVEPLMRDEYRLVAERYEPGETVAVTSCLGFGTRLAHEKLGVPLVNVHLQPSVIWSEYESPVLGPMLVGPRIPRWFKRFEFGAVERLFVDRIAGPVVNPFRTELGLPPARKLMHWWHTGTHILGLFPRWYAAPQPDWPANVTVTQFPLWDERHVTAAPPELEAFLSRFGRPIVFTPGSGMSQGARFFREAVQACRILGRPGLLLTRFREQIPADLPEHVRHFDYVPFSEVLPRSAAIVHHGGIGTTAQSLRAGIPQLIMPMSHDQPDNAGRIRRFGVGDSLRPSAFRGPSVARSLDRLLRSADVERSCRTIADRFEGIEPFTEACEIVERVGDTSRAAVVA